MNDSYDLIVIGAGPGGYPAAMEAADWGKTVAVIDKSVPGGTCLNCGCIPMKTLLHTSQMYRESHEAEKIGLFETAPGCSIPALSEHRQQIIGTLSDGVLMQFKKRRIEYIQGTARITGEHEVTVTGTAERRLTAAHILIASGSEPARIPVPGLDLPGIDTSTTLLERTSLYKSLVIIGGGVIGMEFASFYTDFGIPVTVLEAAPSVLPAVDRETARSLKMILQKRGADIHASAKVTKVEKNGEGLFVCTWSESEQEKRVESEGILVATGRTPAGTGVCTPEIAERLKIGRGRIPVDEQFRTAIPGVYAAGDVTGGIQLAHAATAEGLNAVAHMYGKEPVKDLSLIPSCVYTDPEIASVGISGEEADEQNLETVTGKYLMSANGKSVLSRQERGFIKITADRKTGIILGAQLMCARATDMIGMIELAVSRRITAAELSSLVMPHPTFCEGIAEAAADCVQRMNQQR
ncbi:MAG TPA: dihydrolipoyl dehydrogenase [Treponema sp.]|nr:dihydrolipoyl dehydrogenase [Treponema sp.]